MALWELFIKRSNVFVPTGHERFGDKDNKSATGEWFSIEHFRKSKNRPEVPLLKNADCEFRRAPDKEWRKNEDEKFKTGEYIGLPKSWNEILKKNKMFEDMYVHTSIHNRDLVAFTENVEKGELDIQTVTKPGKFLTRYLKELSMEQIRTLCADFAVERERDQLHITKDPAEIAMVYENGPHSCMSRTETGNHRKWRFSEEKARFNNPAFVYAYGDLAIAYTGPADRATGRCVVWPEKKIYGRCYGYIDKMKILLKQAGYTEDWRDGTENGFNGARLKSISADDNKTYIIMPYVDVAPYCKASGDDLILVGANVAHRMSALEKRMLMNVRVAEGCIPYIDNTPRCCLSGSRIPTGSETILIENDESRIALKTEATRHGVMLTEDNVWTSNYVEVLTNSGIKLYYRLNDKIARCAMTDMYYMPDVPTTTYYHTLSTIFKVPTAYIKKAMAIHGISPVIHDDVYYYSSSLHEKVIRKQGIKSLDLSSKISYPDKNHNPFGER